MIALPGVLAIAAKKAGMNVPEDPENFDSSKFPHFGLFLNVQLGRPMPNPHVHWDNAAAIAKMDLLGKDQVTVEELEEAGVLL